MVEIPGSVLMQLGLLILLRLMVGTHGERLDRSVPARRHPHRG